MTLLENNIIKLRPLEPEDLEIIYQWENDTSLWAVSNTITPFSKFILKKYIEESHLDIYQAKQFRFMIDLKTSETTKTIGIIDLFDFDPHHSRVGLGILIKEDKHKQKGYASNSIEVLLDYVFNTLLVHQVYCNIAIDNKASLKLFKKLGFEIIGLKKDWLKTNEGWKDEYILQLINSNKD